MASYTEKIIRRSSQIHNSRKNPRKQARCLSANFEPQYLKINEKDFLLTFIAYLPHRTENIQKIKVTAQLKEKNDNGYDDITGETGSIYVKTKKTKKTSTRKLKEAVNSSIHFEQKKIFLKSYIFKKVQENMNIPFFFNTKLLLLHKIEPNYELDVFNQLGIYKIKKFDKNVEQYKLIADSHIVGRLRRENEKYGIESIFVKYEAPLKYVEECLRIIEITRNKENTRITRDQTTNIFNKYSMGLDTIIQDELIPIAKNIIDLRKQANVS